MTAESVFHTRRKNTRYLSVNFAQRQQHVNPVLWHAATVTEGREDDYNKQQGKLLTN